MRVSDERQAKIATRDAEMKLPERSFAADPFRLKYRDALGLAPAKRAYWCTRSYRKSSQEDQVDVE